MVHRAANLNAPVSAYQYHYLCFSNNARYPSVKQLRSWEGTCQTGEHHTSANRSYYNQCFGSNLIVSVEPVPGSGRLEAFRALKILAVHCNCVADPGSGAFFTQEPGWKKVRTLDPWSVINIQDHFFKSLVTRLKMLKFFVISGIGFFRIPDPKPIFLRA